jgi:hypothetical protein
LPVIHHRTLGQLIARPTTQRTRVLAFVGAFTVCGLALLLLSYAAGLVAAGEVSSGHVTSPATVVSDSATKSGHAVKFAASQTPASSTPNPTATATPNSAPQGGIGGGSNMITGVVINGIGTNPGPDLAGATKYVRADLKSWGLNASTFTTSGLKVDDLLQGPYSTSGISGLGDPTTWAQNALGWYQQDGCNPTNCPIVEVLNEPGGTWFWGNNSLTLANATAYDALVIATYNVFEKAYGQSRPLLLTSFDGGYSSGSDWGAYMWQANLQIGTYVDGITVHPYDTSSTGLGDQANVTSSYAQAKSLAGRSIPVYITEVGWQTAPTTSETAGGVTPQSGTVLLTTTQQCNNLYNYTSWARGLGYVNAVMFFDYRDDTEDDGTYGIEYSDGSHKPSYAALEATMSGGTNPCP